MDGPTGLLHCDRMDEDGLSQKDPFHLEPDETQFEPNPVEAEILLHAKSGTQAMIGVPGEVRAEFLRILLLGLRKDWPVTVAGVQVFGNGLRITGILELAEARASGGGPLPPLELQYCTIDEMWDLRGAQISKLELTNCSGVCLLAERVEILRSLDLSYSTCTLLNFSKARIGGRVQAVETIIPSMMGMNCQVYFDHASLGDDMVMDQLRCHSSYLSLNNIRINGSFLAHKIRIWNRDNHALQMANAHVSRSVYLTQSRILGQVILSQLQAELLSVHGTYISYTEDFAFMLNGAKVDSVEVNRSVFRGMSVFSDMIIDQRMDLSDCLFAKPFDDTLSLSGTSARALYMFNTRCRGGVLAVSTKFSLVLAPGAVFDGHGSPHALTLQGSTIELDLNFGGHDQLPAARFVGCLSLLDARIGHSLSLIGVSFEAHKSFRICLDMCRTQIGGALKIRSLAGPRDGRFILDGAVIDTLDDNPETGWPREGLLDLDGLTYRAIKIPGKGGLGTELSDSRIAWLKRQYDNSTPEQGEFRPQPFEQLAKVFRGQGYDYAAMQVSIEKRELQRKYADRGIARLIHTGLKITSDYGYSPARALIWFVAWVALGALIAKVGLEADIYERANVDQPGVSHLEPISYAFDLAVPIVDFGQASAYRLKPTCSQFLGLSFCGIRELMEVAYSTIGFILFSILVLTFSGVLRRERE